MEIKETGLALKDALISDLWQLKECEIKTSFS